MSDEIAVLPTYPDLRKRVLMEMDFSVRVHTLLSRAYRTVGDFLDAMGVTDQMLSEMTKEIDGDRRYDVYYKVKNRLEKRIKGCGWATSSNIMSLLTNEVRIADLRRAAEGHKDRIVSDEESILRQVALSLATHSNVGTSAKHIVEVAETFYEFLSAGKEKP